MLALNYNLKENKTVSGKMEFGRLRNTLVQNIFLVSKAPMQSNQNIIYNKDTVSLKIKQPKINKEKKNPPLFLKPALQLLDFINQKEITNLFYTVAVRCYLTTPPKSCLERL